MDNEDIADNLWKECVWLSYPDTCLFCGSNENLDVTWIIPSNYRAIRYDIRNGIKLCRKCRNSIDKDPDRYMDNLVTALTEPFLEELMLEAEKFPTKMNYKKIIVKLKKEIDGIENRDS